jgi:conjugal transfer pilus assembly protein TraK
MPGSTGPSYRFDDASAKRWEQSAPYTQTLTDLMRDMAEHKVPPGYSFRLIRGTDHMPGCEQEGLAMTPRQVVSGHDLIAYVGQLTNTTSRPIEFQEQTCAVKGVLAVASWPGPLLQPHTSSEVYVVVKRGSYQDDTNVRPSALVGGPQ